MVSHPDRHLISPLPVRPYRLGRPVISMDGSFDETPEVTLDDIDIHDVDDLDSLCGDSDVETDLLDSYITGVAAIHAARSKVYDHLTAKVSIFLYLNLY